MSWNPPNKLKSLHKSTENFGMAFQNTRAYRAAGFDVGDTVRITAVGGVLLLSSEDVDDGDFLEIVTAICGATGGRLEQSVTVEAYSSGEGGIQMTVTEPARSVGLRVGDRLTPYVSQEVSGLLALIPDTVRRDKIRDAIASVQQVA